jgi:site-specific recombinase XerD
MPTKPTMHSTASRPAAAPGTWDTRRRQRRKTKTLTMLVDDYLVGHRSEGHSPKTLEWHSTALHLLLRFLDQEGISDPLALETMHLRRWVVWLGSPESAIVRKGRTVIMPRSKRTIHTYTRSAHAFCRWLFVEGHSAVDVTDHFVLPKLGKPLVRILEEEDFARLLDACEDSQYPREFVLRNRGLLWLLYDTGMRVSELAGLTLPQVDLRTGVVVVHGKGDKERRIAVGANALAALRRYLDHGRPALQRSPHDVRVFLGPDGPLSVSGVKQVLRRLKQRWGFTDRRVSAHIFRHTFAVRYLMLGGDPFSLQQLLGHEDMETIHNYMHLNDLHIQTQKRKFSPGDHVSFSATRRRRQGFRTA